jgi:hypothetical protein
VTTRAQRQQTLDEAGSAFLLGLANLRMPSFHLEDAVGFGVELADGDYLYWSCQGGQGGASFVIVRESDGARFNLNLEVTVTKLPPVERRQEQG